MSDLYCNEKILDDIVCAYISKVPTCLYKLLPCSRGSVRASGVCGKGAVKGLFRYDVESYDVVVNVRKLVKWTTSVYEKEMDVVAALDAM